MKIEKLIYGGAGLGRESGRVVLVPYVLPGEEVRIETVREKKDLIEARAASIDEPAAERIEPACKYFTHCGGCHYQQAGAEFQLAQKREILVEVLRRVGKIEAPAEIRTIGGPAWEYRNRAQFHIVKGHIGFAAAGSHELIPIDSCPISSPKINATLAIMKRMAKKRDWPDFLRSIEVFTNERDVQLNVIETEGEFHVAKRFFDWCAQEIPGFVHGPIVYEGYQVSGNSFFQVNRFLIKDLIQTVMAGAEGMTALDLYAGAGLFTLPLASRFDRVTAVEVNRGAYGDLEVNSKKSKGSIETVRRPVEMYLDELRQTPVFVVADPPRAGLGKDVVKQLCRLKPKRLVIVACDPATLARDLAGLTAGGFKIDAMTLVDLFPQTYHMETVVALSA